MEAIIINRWLSSFPPTMYPSFHQDMAIRRFCPARLEQEQLEFPEEEEEDESLALTLHEINELCSPLHNHHIITPAPASQEEDHFVDSFFNMDSYNVNINGESPHQNPFRQGVHDELHTFPVIPNDDFYEDIPMMIQLGDDFEMSSSSCEDAPQYFVPAEDLMVEPYDTTTTTTTTTEDQVSRGGDQDQGLHLVHLLLACAEAVGCRDTQLADSILTQIFSCSNPWGDPMKRVSYCFAMGLKSRLSLLHNVNSNGTFSNGAPTDDVSLITTQEKIEALHLLHQTTPYTVFGFMAANDAICQVAQGKDSLHIVDLGMEHTLQWPSLLRSLSSRTKGPPKLLRITGIVGNQDILELESGMNEIVGQASSLGIPMEFHLIAGPATPTLLTREHLKLREDEALFVNSIVHLHTYVKESRGSLKKILQAIKKLGPTLLTVVEQDANHNGPFFLGRFLESLHYYSAIFDSLEASLERNSSERMKIEKLHFAEEIRNIVAYEGTDRIARHERADQWRRQLGRAGFQAVGVGVGLNSASISQAKAMLSGYGCDGYTVASEKGCLLLGWKGRPIMLASAWQLSTRQQCLDSSA